MPGLRITGGSLRGRRVALPGTELRPTSERARQAFFNIVQRRLAGARFLDLFAGSGVFSLEALSRGAISAVAIDHSPQAAQSLTRLASELNVAVRVMEADVFSGMKRLQNEQFDLIYADPPFDFPRHQHLLEAVDTGGSLADDSIVAIEHGASTRPFSSDGLERLQHWKTVRYGEIFIALFESRNEPES